MGSVTNSWFSQSFVINGLTQVNKEVRKEAKKPELNLTLLKTDALRQSLKNYFPPNFKQPKSKKFTPEAWI